MRRAFSQSERDFLSGLRQVSFSAAESCFENTHCAFVPRTSSIASVRNYKQGTTEFNAEEVKKRRPRNVDPAGNRASLDSHDSGAYVKYSQHKITSAAKVCDSLIAASC